MRSPNRQWELKLNDDGNAVVYEEATGRVRSAMGSVVHAIDPWDPGPDPNPPIPGPLLPLQVSGTQIVTPTGTFDYRGTTAFSLVAQVARGEEAAAIAYLDWAAHQGFNVVRVLTAAFNDWIQLEPEVGQTSLPHLLRLAGARGLYVRVVALSESARYDWRDHARKVAIICAQHANTLYEWANEHYHDGHAPEVQDAQMAEVEATLAVAGLDLPWMASASTSDEPRCLDPECHLTVVDPPWGAIVTRHLSRERDLLNMIRRLKALHDTMAGVARPVLNGEPLGADEVSTPDDDLVPVSNRTNTPWFFYAQGALEAGFGLAGCFHSEAGLRCTLPGPVTTACAGAYHLGRNRVSPGDLGTLEYKNTGHDGSPVVAGDFEDPGGGPIIRAYSFVRDGEGITVVLHRPERIASHTAHLTWDPAWQVGPDQSTYPHVRVYGVAHV